MSINKHIEKMMETKNITSYQGRILQFLWDNKNERDIICLTVPHVGRTNSSRKIKALIWYESKFVNITGLISMVTDTPFDNDKMAINLKGGGMDMCFSLLESFYTRLTPEGVNVHQYDLPAVKNYYYL